MPGKIADRPKAGDRAAPRPRSASFFRTLVMGALAAAAPLGCYESTPDEDAATDGADARDAADAADARDDGTIPVAYGVPDAWEDTDPVPHYGAPEYGVP